MDYEDQKTFTRGQLEKMRVICRGQILEDWATANGGPLVVDVLDSGQFWIQYSREHGLYRCAEKKAPEATRYERDFRATG